MPPWVPEKQPACCLWKGDCSARELAHKDQVWSLQGSLFLLQCLCVGILAVSRGSEGRERVAKPYVTSSPVKRCMLGLPLPTQHPACRHASTLLFALGRRDLPQDHLPPLLCICSFSACQAFAEFKRSYKRYENKLSSLSASDPDRSDIKCEILLLCLIFLTFFSQSGKERELLCREL